MTDQPLTSDETAIDKTIGDFTEHLADIPSRLKALAVNAVGPALQARGEWLRLSSRQAVAVAVLVAVKAEFEALAARSDVAGRCPASPDPSAADDLLHQQKEQR